MRTIRLAGVCLGVLGLSACVGYDVDRLNRVEIGGGTPFTQQLAVEYRELANFEGANEDDWASAELFARRGLAAANGDVLEPFFLSDFYIPANGVAELRDGRYRLMRALVQGARESFPAESAAAQANYDCWVEQTEENDQPEHIRACRDEFYAALALIEQEERPSGVPVYYVFFDFDESVITPDGQTVISQIINDYGLGAGTSLSVVGHTDRSGSVAYNEGLSQRRADSVERALSAGGVPATAITTAFEGETAPLVPTPDGVREPSNRRAEVRFR